MKKFDIILFLIAIFFVVLILLLITAIQNPTFFALLSNLGIFENSTNGIKQAFFIVLGLGVVSVIIIFILFLKLVINMFKGNK
jgi:hypothetical protein